MYWLIVIPAVFAFLGYVIYEIADSLGMRISFGKAVVFAFLCMVVGAIILILTISN
jgi:hypothetical protein